MTGEQEQISINSEKPSLNDLDDLEPVGPGPVVVVTKSRKMSIYGPKFDCGPTQLRKQRLLEKMKKEAQEAMAQKIAELKSAQKELEARGLRRSVEEPNGQTARAPGQREPSVCNDENKHTCSTSLHHYSAVHANKL